MLGRVGDAPSILRARENPSNWIRILPPDPRRFSHLLLSLDDVYNLDRSKVEASLDE